MRHSHSLPCAVLTALVLTACADQAQPTGLAKPPAEDGAAVASLLTEPDINKSDTYLSASLTVESTATMTLAYPLYDPATGAMKTSMTYAAPTETQTVEAAYDYSDRVRVKVTRAADTRDPEAYLVNPARTINTVATGYTLKDAAGAAIPVQYPEGAVTRSPLALLGPLVGEDITAGVVVEYEGQQPVGPRPLGAQAGTTEFPDAETMRVSSSVAPAPASGAPGETAAADGRGQITRTYRHRGSKWVLDELKIESRSAQEGGELTLRQVVRLSNVHWRENPVENARRRRNIGREPRGRDPGAHDVLEPAIGNPICVTSTGPGATLQSCPEPPPDPPPPPPPPPGANIVLQHGIFSSGATWNRMDPWLSSDFYFSRKLIPSLPSTARLAAQADELTNVLVNSGGKDFILVGHSQGGLISRRVAQRRPDLARGVITVGTPHRGAAIARNGRLALSSYFGAQVNNLYRGCTSTLDDAGCYIADFLRRTIYGYAADWGISQLVPVSVDLQPASQFVTALDTAPEYFTRVGIQSYAHRRWVVARLGGDLICHPENWCGGRAMASYASWAQDGFYTCTIIAGLLGYWNTSFWCGYIAFSMYQIDDGWNQLTAPYGDRTDGIVQGSSQVYPRALKQYPINGGDSHVGETTSDYTERRLFEALSVQFGVPRKL
jgi:pimeloyl-ACP methyl ester carboxylesterase